MYSSARPIPSASAGRLACVIFLAGLVSGPLFGQQAEIDPQIVSSGGEHQEGSFGEVYSTIGEPFAGDSVSLDIGGDEATWTGFWHVVPVDTTTGVREEWAPFGSGNTGITTAAPNPFSEEITLYVRLSNPGEVRLRAFDALGREVQRLIDGVREGGTTRIRWQPEGLEPGTYFLRLELNGTDFPVRTIQYVR